MSKQAVPKSVRPNKGKAEYVANKLMAEGRWNQTINDFLESLGDDSPAMLRLEIDQAVKQKIINECQIADLTKQNRLIEAGIAFKQSRLNSFIHRNNTVEAAQAEVIRMWMQTRKDNLRGEMLFRSWLEGPANKDLMENAGFKNSEQAVEWCKGTVPK